MDLKGYNESMDKRKGRLGKYGDPSRAIQEEEPWVVAQGGSVGIFHLKHKDQYGNEIRMP